MTQDNRCCMEGPRSEPNCPCAAGTMPDQQTSEQSRELKACPFCGGAAKRFTIEEPGDNFGGDVIVCTGRCGASSHVEFGRKENLVSLWNERTRPTPDLSNVEELVEKLATGTLSLTSFDGHCVRIDFETREEAQALLDTITVLLDHASSEPTR